MPDLDTPVDLAARLDGRTAPPDLSGAGWVRVGNSIDYLCPSHRPGGQQ